MDELKIKRKCEDMIAYGYVALRQFPKMERHVLSQEIRLSMWTLLRLIIICNRRYHKKTTMQDDVLGFERDLEGHLIDIQNQLAWGTYKTGPYHIFSVFEPKERCVAALPLKDRIVQHAIVAVIEPIWECRFIHDSYACRPGKGAHAGADRAQAFLRKVRREHGRACVLKGDIAKYFPSVAHPILKKLLRRRIVCEKTLRLLDEIIDSTATPGDPFPRGIPIGNLTSQLFANIYMHELDMFVKHELKEPCYLRYMDDFCVVGHDKAHLHRVRRDIEDFLWETLSLRTNGKTQVFPVNPGGRPLDFLGYRIWPTHRKLRKDSVRRMKRKLRSIQRRIAEGRPVRDNIEAVIASWEGHARHADTFNLRAKLLGRGVFVQGVV